MDVCTCVGELKGVRLIMHAAVALCLYELTRHASPYVQTLKETVSSCGELWVPGTQHCLLGVFLLCFVCADKNKEDKTFSFAFLKIMNPDGSIVQDGQYELCVYKFEQKKWKNAAQYLSLPSKKADSHQIGHQTVSAANMTTASGQIQRNFKEGIWMSTICCSTKLTQRSEWKLICVNSVRSHGN